MPNLSKHFKRGDRIEVLKNDVWFPATVLQSVAKRDGKKIQVEFESIEFVQFVDVSNVRPQRPPELHRFFKIGDHVEVYIENAWREGEVKDISENSKYLVNIGGNDNINGVVEVEQWALRLPRDWKDGFWIPPLIQPEEKSSQQEIRSKELKLRIKLNPRISEAKFSEGMRVEVKSDEEGYRGSWYPAVIVELLGNDKCVVEYQTLKTNDETDLLKEEADASCIRPSPPWKQVNRFELLEQVDAWYNDGWWVGSISKVLDKFQYVVYFNTTNEEMVFHHSTLRSHQDWINHKWVTASKSKRKSADLKSKEPKVKIKYSEKISPRFRKSTMVEVKSDEEGYQGSWYTAVIVDSVGNNKLLVEYQTLKTDDECELLKEKTDASYIRPFPPKIQRIDRFKMLEEVDAWYNDGWWVGLICRVLPGLKYVVYFWTTNEEMEFDHFNLRPYQEWINGEWIASFLNRSKLLVKSRIRKSKIQYADITSIASLVSGTKVEVAGEEEGFLASWYPAIIIGPINDGKYLVEYRTLKTDNGLQLLKEEVDALSIRPFPPIIQRKDQYKPLDSVDVWYNHGWWIGQVCQVLEGSNYEVYFKATNQVLEFQHANLRLHQDWMDAKWNVATWGRNL